MGKSAGEENHFKDQFQLLLFSIKRFLLLILPFYLRFQETLSRLFVSFISFGINVKGRAKRPSLARAIQVRARFC